jgi:hypothetical protein
VVVDDGQEPIANVVRRDDRIGYVHSTERLEPVPRYSRAVAAARGEMLAPWDDDGRYDRRRLSTRIRSGPRQRIAMRDDLFMPSVPADRHVASCRRGGQRTANGAEDRRASIPRMTPRTMRASR